MKKHKYIKTPLVPFLESYSWKINALKAAKRAGATLMAGGGVTATMASVGSGEVSTFESMMINGGITVAVFVWNLISNRLKKYKNGLM